MAPSPAWLRGFFVVLGLALAGWATLPLVTRGARVPDDYWVAEGLARKRAAAARPGPKLVLLGGSSVHFGMSARHLNVTHGMAAVNAGIHAGLGRRYILHYGGTLAGPGDVVVLSLEYSLWHREPATSTRNYHVLTGDLPYLYGWPWVRGLELLASVRASEWRTMLAARLRPAAWPPVGGYDPASIDAWGDETATATAVVRSGGLPALHDEVRPYAFTVAAVEETAAFARRLARRGVRVAVAFPGLLRRHFGTANDRFFAALPASLVSHGVTVLDRPAAQIFEADCLYDYAYHPVHRCAVARTDRLAAALRSAGLVPEVR